MCGRSNAPVTSSFAVVAGDRIKSNRQPRIGSIFGPLKVGVTLVVDAVVPLSDVQRAAYAEGNPGEKVPAVFYQSTLVANPDGKSGEGVPLFLRDDVILFADEFELAD